MLLSPVFLALVAQAPGGLWLAEHTLKGSTTQERFGWEVLPLGDLDSDGYSEFLVSSPTWDLGDPSRLGGIKVFSGKTGLEVFRVTGLDVTAAQQLGSRAVALGDVDGDAVPDFAFSAYGSPSYLPASVFIYSGATFSLVERIYAPSNSLAFGIASLCGGVDLDGDSVRDLVVGDNQFTGNFTNQGAVYAYSGATRQLLWRADGTVAWQQFGENTGCIEDLDGDGLGDVLTRSWLAGSKGTVHVLSGRNGVEDYQLEGGYWEAYLGIGGLAGLGDLDGDGRADFAVDSNQPPGGPSMPGFVNIYSGADGSLIHQLAGESPGDAYPGVVTRIGDLDGDGWTEFATSAVYHTVPGYGRGLVYVYTTRDWAVLGRLPGPIGSYTFGQALGGAGEDVTGDGWPDLAIGDDPATVNGMPAAGAAYIYTFDPFLRASVDAISASTGGRVDFDLRFPATEAGQEYRLFVSTDQPGSTILGNLEIPLVPTPLTWDMAQHPPAWFTGSTGSLDATGHATATALVPPGKLASLTGQTLKFAALTVTPTKKPGLSSAAAFVRVEP